jgi:hypothetical protein
VTALIAERVLEYQSGDGAALAFVRIYAPEPNGDDQDWEGRLAPAFGRARPVDLPLEQTFEDWRCQYQISWPGEEFEGHETGPDSWEATLRAMRFVPSAIFATAGFKGGKLRHHGKALRTLSDLNYALALQPIAGVNQ